MIVADLYTDNERIIKTGPTADLFEDKLSDTFYNIGMDSIKLDAYYMGYITYSDLDIYSRTSTGTLNGTIATFKETTSKDNFPIGYLYSETTSYGGRVGTFMEDDEMIINPQGSSNTYSVRNSSLRFINQMYPEYCAMDLTNTNANMYFIVAYYSPTGQYLGQGSIGTTALSNSGIDLSSVSSILNLFQNAAQIDITVPNSTWGDFTFKASDLNTVAFSAQTTLGNMARVFFTSYTVPNIYRVKNGDTSSATIRIDPFVRVEYKEGGQKKSYARQIYGIEFAPTSNYMYSIAYGSSTLTPRGQGYTTIYGNREYTGFYRAGLEGQVNIANISSTNPLAYGGNVLAIRGPETYPDLYFLPICTLDDFRKAFCLAFRLDTGILTNSYVDEITWATVVNPDDGFKANVKTGNITDDGFKTKLRPWQYENFQIDDFDPDEDIPDYDPSGTDPDDGPENEEPPDKDDWGDPMEPHFGFEIPYSFTNYAAFNAAGIVNFTQKLWDAPDDFWDALSIQGRNAANWLDYFVSLRAYPYSVNSTGTYPNIYVGAGGKFFLGSGGEDLYASAPQHVSTYLFTFNPQKHYNNFLDFNPYTKAYIYLPFSGTWEVNPKYLYHSSVYVTLKLDITDGSGVWQVYRTMEGTARAQYVILEKQCKIGVEIPLSGLNATTMSSNIVNASLGNFSRLGSTVSNIAGGLAGGAAGALVGGPIGAVVGMVAGTAISGLEASTSKAEANREQVNVSGAMTGLAAANCSVIPSITLVRPVAENPENFPHAVGHLVNQTSVIKKLNGFTTCRNVDTSQISHAVDAEKAQIKKIMEGGFYA